MSIGNFYLAQLGHSGYPLYSSCPDGGTIALIYQLLVGRQMPIGCLGAVCFTANLWLKRQNHPESPAKSTGTNAGSRPDMSVRITRAKWITRLGHYHLAATLVNSVLTFGQSCFRLNLNSPKDSIFGPTPSSEGVFFCWGVQAAPQLPHNGQRFFEPGFKQLLEELLRRIRPHGPEPPSGRPAELLGHRQVNH